MNKQEQHLQRLTVKLADFKHNQPALKILKQWIKDQRYSIYKKEKKIKAIPF